MYMVIKSFFGNLYNWKTFTSITRAYSVYHTAQWQSYYYLIKCEEKMKYKSSKRKISWKKITEILLFITLILSIIFTIIKLVNAPSDISDNTYTKSKMDYIIMLLQCIAGIVLIAVPSIVERKLSVDIPDKMEVMYLVFLFCAIYLGEVKSFYSLIPYWDDILHAFSGGMLGALGFSLVCYFNNTKFLNINLSPLFVAIFAFCFALAAGAVWEIYEFLADVMFGTNMQKFIVDDGTILIGNAALRDTMTDIIIDALSSLLIAVIGYYMIKNKDIGKDRVINKKDRN